MFFPIRTDQRLLSTPWINYSLIGANALVFLLTSNDPTGQTLAPLWLNPTLPRLPQFITYQFIHGNLMHLLGNMLFLYVFGNSVEDRLGKISYLCFYLTGGVLAGLGHALVEPNPVLGASGAVAAVSGAYLALFPKTNVTIVYWFIFIGTFEVSSMLLILFQIAQDAVMFMGHYGGVAYLAHLSGYAYGFLLAMGLLRFKLLPRQPYDLLALIEHRRRRTEFASLTRKGYRPWDAAKSTISQHQEPAQPADPHHQHNMTLRSRISRALNDHDLHGAAQLYTELLGLDPAQVMNRQQQLDLANQLMSQQRYKSAAHAYELFLSTYKTYSQREQIELILGLIYTRYLHQHQRAGELLSAAIPRLQDPVQRALAQQTLDESSR